VPYREVFAGYCGFFADGSTGMSLNRREFIANWRRLTPAMWVKVLLATFIVPPSLALGLGQVLPIGVGSYGRTVPYCGGTRKILDTCAYDRSEGRNIVKLSKKL
jgi:hypothetical protein